MILLLNKLKIHRFLAKSEQIASFLPETMRLKKSTFKKLVSKYSEVYIKPTYGGKGLGVIKVSAKKNQKFIIHHENRKEIVKGFENAYESIKALTKSRLYIVQQCIQLAKINQRPTDMRVIVQRKTIHDSWEVTGKVIKIAGKGYIVTNITKSHGKLMKVEKGIKQIELPKNIHPKRIISEIEQLSQKIATKLNSLYPKHRTYGLDMAIDKNGHIWIIEVNRTPALSHFTKLNDKTMLRRILRYKKGS